MSPEALYEKLLKLRYKETENGRRSFIATPLGLVDTAGLPATSPTYFEGCTEDEIQEVMNAQGVTFLPDNYRRFLRIMGKGSGYPFAFPESWQYSTLFTIRQSGQWLLDFVKSGLVLPHDAFVFYFDQTMYFCFFNGRSSRRSPSLSIHR
jgi:hypothetical protein